MRTTHKLVAAIAVLAIAASASQWGAHHWRPSPELYPRQGVDVSAAQGEIAWDSVKAAGARFAYLRATEGSAGRDARFAANWDGAAAAGLERGAIHVFSLCALARDQATNFLATVPRAADALAPAIVLDFRDPACTTRPDRAVVIDELATFLRMIEAQTGKPALLAVDRRFDAAYQISAIVRPLWLTGPYLSPSYAARAWTMWQANRSRRVDGIDGPVNWDVARP